MAAERVGLVLAGGGARGAYEVGALSVLLPALEARDERPTVLVGASVGAINVAYLAANADLGAGDAVARGVEPWGSLAWDKVLGPLLARSTALRAISYAVEVLGVPGANVLDGTLVNQLVQDVRDLARVNRLLGDRADPVTSPSGWRYRGIPFIFITPQARADVAGLAERIFEEHYEGLEALRSVDLSLLARLIGNDGPGHGDLLSYLFFAPEFAGALIELGRSDAQRWLTAHTGPEGPWELEGGGLLGD